MSRLGDPGAPVAGALAGVEALDVGDVAAQRHRRLQAVARRGSAPERVHAVDRDPAADHVEVATRGRAASRRCWRRGASARVRSLGARGELREALELLAQERLVLDRRPSRSASTGRPGRPGRRRPRASISALDHGRGRARRARPMPVSYLTWTRWAQAELRRALGDRVEETLAPDARARPGRERHVELGVGQRAHHEDRRLGRPASRSSNASLAVATASQLAPPASAARGALDHAVAVAVGLDDRAELAPPLELEPSRLQLRSIAPRSIPPSPAGRRAHARASAPPAAPRSHRRRSRDSACRVAPAAIAPGAGVRETPAQAASNGSIPRAISAAIVPESTSPVPAVARAGAGQRR